MSTDQEVGAAYATAARAYVGTRWHHQGRRKGRFIDCVGVLVCAARDIGLGVRDVNNYPGAPSGTWLIDELRAQMHQVEISDLQLGDVLCFSFSSTPWHVGVVTSLSPLAMVHAWKQVTRCVEMPLDDSWRRRICSAWRLPYAELLV